MMPIPTLDRLLAEARAAGPRRIAVAAAATETALAAAAIARRQRIADPVLLGGRAEIEGKLRGLGEDPALFQIVPALTRRIREMKQAKQK